MFLKSFMILIGVVFLGLLSTTESLAAQTSNTDCVQRPIDFQPLIMIRRDHPYFDSAYFLTQRSLSSNLTPPNFFDAILPGELDGQYTISDFTNHGEGIVCPINTLPLAQVSRSDVAHSRTLFRLTTDWGGSEGSQLQAAGWQFNSTLGCIEQIRYCDLEPLFEVTTANDPFGSAEYTTSPTVLQQYLDLTWVERSSPLGFVKLYISDIYRSTRVTAP